MAEDEFEKNFLIVDKISVVFVGHVDAGKSSLAGRILLETNAIDRRKVDKMKVEAEAMNKGSFYLAQNLDNNKAERERGITIVSNTKVFFTPKKNREITIVDAPGHRDFINNMITGAAQTDVGLLVVSAVSSEFRAGIDKSGQTLEHTLLINALGVQRMVIAVNKMDDVLVNFKKEKFDEIVEEMKRQIKKLGGKLSMCQFVPVSGFYNHNITSVDKEKMPWYDGDCLVDILENLPKVKHNLKVPFRMTITNCYKVSGVGEVIAGRIYTGKLKIGDKVEINESKNKAVIKSIEKFHKPAETAFPGDNIGITIKSKQPADLKIKKGDMIGAAGTDLTRTLRFKYFGIATCRKPFELATGFMPVFFFHTDKKSCQLAKLTSITEIKSKRQVTEERKSVKQGDAFVGEFQPMEGSISVETHKDFGLLTRMVMRNSNDTIAVGQCKEILNKDYEKNIVSARRTAKFDNKKQKKKKA